MAKEKDKEQLSAAEAEQESADHAAEKQAAKAAKRTPEAEANRALNKVKLRKKFKYGALSVIITLVVAAVIVALNVICNVLDNRYNWNIDLTSSGLYEIDEQTINYLHQLNTDVEITVLADERYFLENNNLKVVSETLNRFRTESNGHISVSYVDTTKNPEAVSKYSANYSGTLSAGDVVIANGDLVRVLGLYTDIVKSEQSVDYSTYSTVYNYTFVGEQALISALMGVTDLNPVSVAMIDKMNGASMFYTSDNSPGDLYNYAAMMQLLEKNNYNLTEVDLATDPLSPEDYDIAILCSPCTDLTEAQIKKLTDFLNNDGQYGKTMLFFDSMYRAAETPNLNAFLEIWGIHTGDAWVLESDPATAQIVTTVNSSVPSPVAVLTEDSLNENVVESKLPIVAPVFRPVETLFSSNTGRTTSPLLVTSDSCYLMPFDAGDDFSSEQAEKSSYNLAVRSTTTFTSGSDTYSSELITFGSAWFCDHYVLNNAAAYDNANYLITLLNTITGKESGFTVAEKSLNKAQLTGITTSNIKSISIVIIAIIPLTVALIGFVVFFRRRNR